MCVGKHFILLSLITHVYQKTTQCVAASNTEHYQRWLTRAEWQPLHRQYLLQIPLLFYHVSRMQRSISTINAYQIEQKKLRDVQQEREGTSLNYFEVFFNNIKQFFRSILLYLGLSWSILDYLVLSWCILVDLGLFRSISVCLGLSRTISDYLGLS